MLRRYMPDGSVRAIWPKKDSVALREIGQPVRAGNIKIVEDPQSRYCGFFYADLSALAETLGEARFDICLFPPSREYEEANRQEEAYIQKHYVLGDA